VLRIRDFIAGQTRSALKASIDFIDLQESPLVIDLRESGGGDLFEALDCAGLFVSQGKSLGGLITRESGKSMVFSPPGDKVSMPVVLLVGPDTASAAEVFAAALHSNDRAILVGRPTFGKCLTQTEVTLSDGSVLRITNGRILLPEGIKCSAEGLVPDVHIPEYRLYNDAFLLDQGCTASAFKPQSR
jgi:carboxyl-terminal processing protease